MPRKVDPNLWDRGVIAPWYLYEYQLPVYEFLRGMVDPFFEATRRFGKTTTELTIDVEDCLRESEWVVLWCEPWKDQARNIVVPEMSLITASCPRHLEPRFYRTDSFYEFPSTGSRIYLIGVNEDKAESARGRKANKAVRDEYGSWRDARYISDEVLRPVLLTTHGQMATMSTPPRDLAHQYYDEKGVALAMGRLIQRDFDAVDTISEEEKERFITSMGGRFSTAVRRELYLEPVSDPERLVIPEYTDAIHDVPDDYPTPSHFDAYVGIDLGFNDSTAMLFAYVDFVKRELVIDDMLLVSGKNSKEITDSAKATEARIWGRRLDDGRISLKPDKEIDRVSDNDLQQIYDMQTLCNYFVRPTAKDDKIAALNALRLLFTEGRIKIKKRCEALRYQLKVGLWNDRRTDFQRGEKTGHLDAIAALIYLSRNVNWQHNPYPQYGQNVSHATHYLPDSDSRGTEEQALAAAFGSAL